MEKRYHGYLYILIATQLLIFVSLTLITFFGTESVSAQTEEALREESMRMVEDEMRARIDLIFAHIETKSEAAIEEVGKFAEAAAGFLAGKELSELAGYIQACLPVIRTMEYGNALEFILYDASQGTITRFLGGERIQDLSFQYDEESLAADMALAAVCETLAYGDSTLYIYANQKRLDEIVKAYIHGVIHNAVYDDDTYIWVNEVLNYEGGGNYAIRAIHPSLKENEGSYLSTHTEDAVGNLLYLAELEGINQNGEVFHTYYLKDQIDGEIAEKASYARLYEPYNWIIATGEPIESIQAYADELVAHNSRSLKVMLRNILLSMLLVFAIVIGIIIIAHRKNQRSIDQFIETETKLDPLTGALTRKAGESLLAENLRNFREGGKAPLLLMLDLDDFKKVNDTYGHDVGDVVLRRTVQAVSGAIRSTDYVIRWGGEEFIVLCCGLERTQHRQFAEKIRLCVHTLSFESGKDTFGITISLGGTFFREEDVDHLEALRRADMALYTSKRSGKDRYTCADES